MKIDTDKYYVYVIYDTSNMKPIYVGKGRKNRAKWHISASKFGYHYNKKLERKLKKITNNFNDMSGVSIHIDSEYEKERDALDREVKMIAEIGLINLCNLSTGGDSPTLSEDSLRRIVKSRRSNGLPWHSDITRKRIGESRRGKPHSEETKRKFKALNRKPMLGKHHTDETKRLMSINHADFNGKNNPFFGKTHTKEVKDGFRLKYGYAWIIYHDGKEVSVIGKGGVREYVENYNRETNSTISYNTLIVYKKIDKHNIKIVKGK